MFNICGTFWLDNSETYGERNSWGKWACNVGQNLTLGFVVAYNLQDFLSGKVLYSVSSRTKLSTFIGQNFKSDVPQIFQLGMINYHLNRHMKPKKVILTRGHSPVTEILDFD